MPAPPPWSVVPFVLMLVAVAAGPVLARHRWESNATKAAVSAALALPVVAAYLAIRPDAVGHAVAEYTGFVIFLGGLYVVAGGIQLRGDLTATPATNTAFLAIGAALASVVGTTGASMLLIRPLLQTNGERTRVWHTVLVFIFLVSNIGGMLTPLGDPPLFLGYLRGVPFTWTFRLWRPWLFLTVTLLALYLVWDTVQWRREPAAARQRDREHREPLRLRGLVNAVWLVAVVLAVLLLRAPWREAAIVAVAGVSLVTTPAGIRAANRFTAGPMLEVAAVFLGIFLTMIPALELLHASGAALGLTEPWHFFWATGLLSAVLDNAPTYLALLAIAQGLDLPAEVVGVPHRILAAISLGAVTLGANTYIGNAPNFMVKTIAEQSDVAMPSFLAYTVYSTTILVPLYVAVTLLFL